jgi:diguanylate cyclase (GGDEF)-like protein/PAS domain S-box-containing protein
MFRRRDWRSEVSSTVRLGWARPRTAEISTAAVLDASPVATVVTGPDGLVDRWNLAAERLLGWTAAQVIGRSIPIKALTDTLDVKMYDAGAGEHPAPVQLRCRDRDGRMRDIEAATAVIHGPAGRAAGMVGLLFDVTTREKLHRQLRHQAHHDSLTGLPNRDMFAEQATVILEDAARAGTRTGMLLIDLDKFKDVNDTLGHLCGDQLLAQIGPRLLAGTLRAHDLVARLSGDEFVVLLPDLPSTEVAVTVAERILAALHSPFIVGGTAQTVQPTRVDVAASIGVAVAPDHGSDPAGLLRHADTAMYQAKQASAGVEVYQPGHGEPSAARFGLLGELRRALDHDELILHYQPKINIATGGLDSVEALVRWQHPERGLLPPAEFIPMAETTGLIVQLTTRVLHLALTQAATWAKAGKPIPVAVNLSARVLHDPALPGRILTALADHGVPAELLWLEVTESAIMHDPATAVAILCELAEAGIRLSLDDFGTGYSSMTYLRKLPVTELKIDRSFIIDLAGDDPDEILARSAVDLGHNLGLTVVAEGIEDAATLASLTAMGCDIAQGYYFARPMPPDQLGPWITSRDAQARWSRSCDDTV